jgi:hypothetical protein
MYYETDSELNVYFSDLKDLSLPLLGSNDFSSDLGCLDFLDNEMSLHNAYIDNANKLIQ